VRGVMRKDTRDAAQYRRSYKSRKEGRAVGAADVSVAASCCRFVIGTGDATAATTIAKTDVVLSDLE
jgi:hypothetical protein